MPAAAALKGQMTPICSAALGVATVMILARDSGSPKIGEGAPDLKKHAFGPGAPHHTQILHPRKA